MEKLMAYYQQKEIESILYGHNLEQQLRELDMIIDIDFLYLLSKNIDKLINEHHLDEPIKQNILKLRNKIKPVFREEWDGKKSPERKLLDYMRMQVDKKDTDSCCEAFYIEQYQRRMNIGTNTNSWRPRIYETSLNEAIKEDIRQSISQDYQILKMLLTADTITLTEDTIHQFLDSIYTFSVEYPELFTKEICIKISIALQQYLQYLKQQQPFTLERFILMARDEEDVRHRHQLTYQKERTKNLLKQLQPSKR